MIKFLYCNFVISLWLTAITTLFLGIFVLIKNYKNVVNKTFALYSFSICWWGFCQIWLIACDKRLTALIWTRIEQVGVFFIPTLFVHFVISLLNIKIKKGILGFAYIVSTFFALLCPTALMMADAVPKKSIPYVKYFATPGLAYHLAILYFIVMVTYGLAKLYKAYITSSGLRQNQLKYLVWSTLFGYLGGGANFLLVYGISIPFLNPFGTYALPIYIIIVAYAIHRHHLMDARIFSLRVFLFAIVYIVVLGIPVGLATLGKNWLSGFGDNWYPYLLFLGMASASAGHFIFLYLRRRTENALLHRQRGYQNVLLSLAKRMTKLRSTAELFKAIGTTIVDTVKPSFAGIYLKDKEHSAFKIQFSHPKEDRHRFDEFLPLDHPIIKELSERKKPLLTSEVSHSVDRQGLYFSLIVPSFVEDELSAFIVLGVKPNRELYTENDIIVFETLSYSMALAIENCFFWENVEDNQRKARIEELDTFSYSVAHEIHNPMSSVSGNADLLMRLLKKINMTTEQFQDVTLYLNHIIKDSDRVSKMVEAIHQLGMKTSGEYGPLDIRKVVEIFSEAHAPELKYGGVTFIKEIPDEPIFINGEQGELLMVFDNFYKNSMHALLAAPVKKITIRVEKITSDKVRISFSDTGYGIVKDKLHIVFTPFVTTKASTEGSGMGLHLVKGIISRHKGKAWAESEGKDKGATLILELPILKDVKIEKAKEDRRSKWGF